MSTSSFLKLLLLHIYLVMTINERTTTRYTEAVQERVYLTRSILAVRPEPDSMAKSHSNLMIRLVAWLGIAHISYSIHYQFLL